MIRFLYNPTSWVDGQPVPGGMADCLVQPILPHLSGDYELADRPADNRVNVYYSHARKYGGRHHTGPSVFVSHGIADKAWRNGNRVKCFDYVVVSGPSWSHRMAAEGVDPARIVEAGYTKLDPIFNGEIPSPQRDGRVRVVYAPTHGGGGETRPGNSGEASAKYTTHHRRDEILALLPDTEFDVVVALHPRHRPDGRSTLAEYVGADVVIADGGSTIYEAMALDIPVVFPSWLVAASFRSSRRANTFEAQLYRDHVGTHVDRAVDLPAAVQRAAVHGISLAEQDFIEPIFPREYRGESGRLHAEALDSIATQTPRRRPFGPAPLVFEELGAFRVVMPGTPEYEWMVRSGSWRFVGWLDDDGALRSVDVHALRAEAKTPARRRMLDRLIREDSSEGVAV